MASKTAETTASLAQRVLALNKFSWWQIKKCRRAGKQVYITTIQAPDRTDLYWDGQDESVEASIDAAIAKSEEPAEKPATKARTEKKNKKAE